MALQILELGGIRGVTLLGGEPFDQALPLSHLARALRAGGLDVITFTGFTHERLIRRSMSDAGVKSLLGETDLLVDGPFLQDQVDRNRPWLGSKNQRFIPLTSQGVRLLPLDEDRDIIEITVDSDGATHINGWADSATLASLVAAVQRG